MCLLPIYMQFLFNFLLYVMCITLGMSTSGVKRGAIFNLKAEWICFLLDLIRSPATWYN